MLTDRWVVIGGGYALVLSVALALSGLGATGVPADQRTAAILRGHAAATHATLMQTEDRVPAGAEGDDAQWIAAIERVDQALAARNISAALREWQDAYALALGSRGWPPMVEVGDAALRIGAATSLRRGYEASARDAYLLALVRARRLGSPEGVLRVADAFAALGDDRMAQDVRRISERLATNGGPPEF